MKIVLFTSVGAMNGELFQYIFSRISESFSDVHVVAVAGQSRQCISPLGKFRRKLKTLGVAGLIELAVGYPLQMFFLRRDCIAREQHLAMLPRRGMTSNVNRAEVVTTVNGPDAVSAIRALEPDVVIQAGAGILREQVFSIAKLGTLNLHHGIAPLIKGRDSIYWALWERRSDWIGSTVHIVDAGIDTGRVLAYAPIERRSRREGFPSLFARATEAGVSELVNVLQRLSAGEDWMVSVPVGRPVYRSTFPGWRRFFLFLRQL